MNTNEIRRAMLRGARADDLEIPDPVRCAIALKNLNEAFQAVSKHGLQEIGLDDEVTTALTVLKASESDRAGVAPSDTGILVAIPLSLLHDAVVAAALPNRDHQILSKLRVSTSARQARERQDQADERSRAQLQWCTLTVDSDHVRIRNRVESLEIEASTPALVDSLEPGLEAAAFTMPFHILSELFDRTHGAPNDLSWSKERDRKQVILLHFLPSAGTLRLIYGSARISLAMETLVASEPPLSSLASDMVRSPLATAPLSRGLTWALMLGAGINNASQEGGAVIATGKVAQIVYRDNEVDQNSLVIGVKPVKPLQSVLRRFEDKTTIRSNGDHHFIEAGVVTLSFPTARASAADYRVVEEVVLEGGHRFELDGRALAVALSSLSIFNTSELYAELLLGDAPHLKLGAQDRNVKGKLSWGVTYVPVYDVENCTTLADRAFELDLQLLARLVNGIEDKPIKFWLHAGGQGVMLAHQFKDRSIRAVVNAKPVERQPHDNDVQMTADPVSPEPAADHASEFADQLVLATTGDSASAPTMD